VLREDGAAAAAGVIGSVQIRGPNLFRQYWNKPEALRDGLVDTGDLGQLDAAGYLTLVGRKHDLIIASGYNVYPQVVERVIGECPGVAECAVLGVPDAQRANEWWRRSYATIRGLMKQRWRHGGASDWCIISVRGACCLSNHCREIAWARCCDRS